MGAISLSREFFFLSLIVPAVAWLLLLYITSEKPTRWSKGVLVLFLFSMFINVALSQNYIASLIPNSEGIGISNPLAYWVIGEDNWAQRWSPQLFRAVYDASTLASMGLLFLYAVLLIIEESKRSV